MSAEAQARLLIRPSARTIRWVSFAVIAATGSLRRVDRRTQRERPRPGRFADRRRPCCACGCASSSRTSPWRRRPPRRPRCCSGGRCARRSPCPSIAAVWFAYTWIGPLTGPSAGDDRGVRRRGSCSRSPPQRWRSGSPDPGRGGLVAGAVVVFILLVIPVAIGRPTVGRPRRSHRSGPVFTYWSAIAIASSSPCWRWPTSIGSSGADGSGRRRVALDRPGAVVGSCADAPGRPRRCREDRRGHAIPTSLVAARSPGCCARSPPGVTKRTLRCCRWC